MNENQINNLKKVIYTYGKILGINGEKIYADLVNRLSSMNEEDVMDYLIVAFNDMLEQGRIKKEELFSNIDLVTSISSKYPDKESLINRLNWLKNMNMLHPKMPLTENHQLVVEAFDEFNKLIGTKFDSYYTGGFMGYLYTNHPLERYHGDLDLFINEEELKDLIDLVSTSDNFKFISNMDIKEKTGHEFKIQYKDTDMSIGLFLFERKPNGEVIIKDYYNKDNEIVVDLIHLSPEYANLQFDNKIITHNNIPYRMQSIEAIYNSKKNSRPKDKYDAKILRDSINLSIYEKIDKLKDQNYIEIEQPTKNSIVIMIAKEIKNNNRKINTK